MLAQPEHTGLGDVPGPTVDEGVGVAAGCIAFAALLTPCRAVIAIWGAESNAQLSDACR